MALSMPIVPKPVLPSAIKGQTNGAVDPKLLWTVEAKKTGLVWLMAELPARGMRAMHAAALTAGIVLGSTGRGRTYEQQVTLFLSRYVTEKTVYKIDPKTGQPVYQTKVWNGVTYWQLPGTAMAAIPGTSNHGWWCADDLAEWVDGVMLSGMRQSTLQWLYGNAHRFGFAWETIKENWHVHWIAGDKLPQAVLDYEAGWPSPVPTPPTPPVTSKLMITIYKLTDALAVFVAYTFNGVALIVEWSGDGTDPRVQERLSILKQFGANEVPATVQDIGRCTLIGPLPKGDSLHEWQSSDFVHHVPGV